MPIFYQILVYNSVKSTSIHIFFAQIPISSEILHKIYCLYKFDTDFIPNTPISSHFEQSTRWNQL